MKFIKPLAIALPVAIGTMLSGVTVAQAGEDFADVSAAFAAQFGTVNSQLDTAINARDEAIAANQLMSSTVGEADSTYDAYVNIVDGMTTDNSINISLSSDAEPNDVNDAASAYKNAFTAYKSAMGIKDSLPSDAAFTVFDDAFQNVENSKIALLSDSTLQIILDARTAVENIGAVEGVTQAKFDTASDLVLLGKSTFDNVGTAEIKNTFNTAITNDTDDIPVTAKIANALKDNVSEYAKHELYNHSPKMLFASGEMEAYKELHKLNTQIAFQALSGETEITDKHIEDANGIVSAGVIVDVTQDQITAATNLVFAKAISQSEIDAAKITSERSVVTQDEIDTAVEKIKDINGNYSVTVEGYKDTVIIVGTVDDTEVGGTGGPIDVSVNEDAAFAARSALVNDADDDASNNTDWTLATVNGHIVTAEEAQQIVDVYDNQQIVNAGAISTEEIAAALKTAGRDEVTDEDIQNAIDLKNAGIINVLTQAEYEAAKAFETKVGEIKGAVEAMKAAEAALIKAIEDSDDKAIKSAEKALKSATAVIENVRSINLKVVDAINAVNAGTMSIRHFNEKIKPDVGVAISGAMSGVTVVNNTIGSHQNTLVASSGKYGLEKHSGVNAGSAPLNMGVWLKAFGSDSEMDMRDGVAGYDADTHGVVIGIDQIIGNDMLVGMALSFAGTDVEGKSTARSITDTDQIQGTLYGTLFMNDFFINGSVAYAHSSSATERTGFGVAVTGEYDTSTYSASVGAGMPIDMESYAITPQITLAYSHVNPDEYTESGFGALKVSPESMDLFGIKAGVTINKKLVFDGGTLSPKLRLIADWDVLQEKALVNSSWVSTGTTVTPTSGPKPAALGGIFGAGVDYATDDGVYVFSIDYDLSTRSDFVSHAASAQFRFNF